MPRILLLLLVLTSPLAALAQPNAVTVGSSNVTINSADLHGTVSQHNSRKIFVTFVYQSAIHSGQTPTQTIPPGSSTVAFTHSLEALPCGTAYTFWVLATVQGLLDDEGDQLQFSTPACPFAVTSNPPTGTTFNGSVQPPFGSTADTFFRAAAPGLIRTTPVQTVSGNSAFSYTPQGLPCGASIEYQAAATSNGDTVYGRRAAYTTSPCSRAESDFNGDGQVDLMWRDPATGALEVWHYRFDTRIEPLFTTTLPSLAANVHIVSGERPSTADNNDDYWPDLITWNSTTGEVRIVQIQSNLVTRQTVVHGADPASWTPVASLGNSQTVVWRKHATNELLLWRYNQPALWLPSNPQWTLAGTADFDRNGTYDLLFHDPAGAVRVWLLNPDFTFKAQYRLGWITSDWAPVGAADIATNSLTAVMLRNISTGRAAVWLATKDPATGAITVTSYFWIAPDQPASRQLVLPN